MSGEPTAIVTVRTERDYPAGYRTDETHTYRWAGYTAKDAMNHRIERLKESHRDYDRNGMEIITAIDKGEWLETTTYRYEDGAA